MNEDKNFEKLLNYCKNEQEKGNPTFLVVSNPDFDIFVLKHNEKYKNQDKLHFLKVNYNYKNLASFKNDSKIFEKFNPSLDRYKKVSSSALPENLIVYNDYKFNLIDIHL